MPSGSSNIGRNTPNTPGSMNEGDESTGTPMARGRGVASRNAADIRRHRSHHENTRTPKPIAQSASRIGTRCITDCDGCNVGAGLWETSAPKGAFTCSMRSGTLDSAGVMAVCRPSWPPANTRSEKGTRNLADAASQRQYRVCARFFLKGSVRRPAIPANSVDCQRWFAMDSKSLGIIPASPVS